MSVSIETSRSGFKTLDADQEYDDAAGAEIYRNLRWLEAHELAGLMVILTSRSGSASLHIGANRWRISLLAGRCAGLESQQDAKVAKIISGGSGDDGVA
jgi:hypothetical protein